MADGKFICYSFYVHENDTQLQRFMDSQANLSLTVRLLMKAFLAGNGGLDPETIDVGIMDLNALIQSMQVRPELAEPMRRRGSRRESARMEPVAPKQDPVPAADVRSDAVPAAPAVPSAPERASAPAKAPAPASAPAPAPAPEVRQDRPAARVPEPEPEEDPDDGMPDVTMNGNSGQAPAPAPAPASTAVRSGRDAYNQSMRAGMTPVDDIASLMGEL